MENYFYAQLSAENVCVCISSLSGEMLQDFMIRIDSMNYELLGMRFDNLTNSWELVEPTQLPLHASTQLDRIEEVQLNSSITNEYVACLLELGI